MPRCLEMQKGHRLELPPVASITQNLNARSQAGPLMATLMRMPPCRRRFIARLNNQYRAPARGVARMAQISLVREPLQIQNFASHVLNFGRISGENSKNTAPT